MSTWMSSFSIPTMLLTKRGPSSSSMIATLYGVTFSQPGSHAWWKTKNEWTLPVPFESTHSIRSERQTLQIDIGGNQTCPQSLHF